MTDRTDGVTVLPVIGKTIHAIEDLEKGSERVVFRFADGTVLAFWHESDCCESVQVEDVAGDPADLVGRPLLQAEETTNQDNPPRYADSFTWTFYKFATTKGYVTVRWLGESNGYYSESVSWQVSS